MRKLVIALTLSTTGFAASTLYFWHAWQGERSRVAHASPPTTATAPATTPSATWRRATQTPRPQTPAPATRPSRKSSTEEEQRARVRASVVAAIPYMRAMLEDPDKRAEAMRDFRKNNERSMPRLAKAWT